MFEHDIILEKYPSQYDSMGKSSSIGWLDSRPITLSFSWTKMNDVYVCFYYPIDWKIIEEWMERNFPLYKDHHTDASIV